MNINEELVGFFGGSRGLRKGDPLSSYLFVLIMDTLSMLLQERLVAAAEPFSYHWRCSKTKLTHLCFADDLLLFCGNSLSSLRTLLQTLQEFSSMTGLTPNGHKSSIFIVGTDRRFKEEAQRISGFQEEIGRAHV